jgi:hypothetical protein
MELLLIVCAAVFGLALAGYLFMRACNWTVRASLGHHAPGNRRLG